MPPVEPMLAKLVREVPVGGFLYEPKWDGFRCIVYRDGSEVELGSRNGRSLTRYFPEVVAEVRRQFPARCVFDGEVVVAGPNGLDFEALSQRIHPARSRVAMLAAATPASYVAFDALAADERDLRGDPWSLRREALEAALGDTEPPVHVTPLTGNAAVARDWFARFEGAGLDGVMAKPSTLTYRAGERAMWKVKHERTGEFVVGGFRWYRGDRRAVGSLLLGLYDEGELHHVGVIGAFPASERVRLVEHLAAYRHPAEHPWAEWARWADAAAGGTRPGAGAQASAPPRRLPGAVSRWNADKDLSFEPLRPDLVVEAAFEHLQGRRLRHTAQFRRWRPDRDPRGCTYDQLDVAVPSLLADVFGARG